MIQLTVTYMINEQQVRQLENLLPHWRNYVNNDGKRPFADWTIGQLFESVMTTGCWSDIDRRIADEQYRQGDAPQKSNSSDGGVMLNEI